MSSCFAQYLFVLHMSYVHVNICNIIKFFENSINQIPGLVTSASSLRQEMNVV